MNQDFPLFSLTQPETAQRRNEKPRLINLSPERIDQRKEIADNLKPQVQKLSQKIQQLSQEDRKNVLIKLEHDQKISLSGTDLKSISEPNSYFTLATPRTENLERLESKIQECRAQLLLGFCFCNDGFT